MVHADVADGWMRCKSGLDCRLWLFQWLAYSCNSMCGRRKCGCTMRSYTLSSTTTDIGQMFCKTRLPTIGKQSISKDSHPRLDGFMSRLCGRRQDFTPCTQALSGTTNKQMLRRKHFEKTTLYPLYERGISIYLLPFRSSIVTSPRKSVGAAVSSAPLRDWRRSLLFPHMSIHTPLFGYPPWSCYSQIEWNCLLSIQFPCPLPSEHAIEMRLLHRSIHKTIS
jgi:hypothetical protein